MSRSRKRSGPPRTQARHRAREQAVQALYQWHLAKTSPAEIEVQFRSDQDMAGTDTDLFGEFVRQIPARAEELDAHFGPLLDRRVSALDPVELAILRLGTYELAERLEVPYRVVIHEAVKLARTYGATDSHKYINGVLDKLAKTLRATEISG